MKTINMKELLLKERLQPTARSGDVLLLNIFISEQLLAICEQRKLGVLGIEGFKFFGSKLCPDTDFIADFSVLLSDDNFEIKSVKAAKQFLRLADEDPNILFEFLLVNCQEVVSHKLDFPTKFTAVR